MKPGDRPRTPSRALPRLLPALALLLLGLGWVGEVRATTSSPAGDHDRLCACGRRCHEGSCCCSKRAAQAPTRTPAHQNEASPATPARAASPAPCLGCAPCQGDGLPSSSGSVATESPILTSIVAGVLPIPGERLVPRAAARPPERRADPLEEPPELGSPA